MTFLLHVIFVSNAFAILLYLYMMSKEASIMHQLLLV